VACARRVSIARAFIARPPSSSTILRPRSRPITSQTIISLILRLRDVYGVTALLATHRLQDGFALANFHFDPLSKKVRRDSSPESAHVAPTRFSSCAQGKIYFEGTPDELMKSHDRISSDF